MLRVLCVQVACLLTLAAADHDPADFRRVIEGRVFDATLTLQGEAWNDTLVRNCRFTGCAGDGILLRDVARVVITGCSFDGIRGRAAIRLSISGGTRDVTIEGNRISSVQQNGISAGQRSGAGIDHRRLRIIGNTIDTSGLASGYRGLTHHIYVQAQDALIEGNRLVGSRDGNGISIRSSGVVRGNIIGGRSLGGPKSGTRYYSDHMRGPSNRLLIEHNRLDNREGSSGLVQIFDQAAHYDGATGHIVETFVIRGNTIISRDPARVPLIISDDFAGAPYRVEVCDNILVSTAGAEHLSGPTTRCEGNVLKTDLTGVPVD